MKYKHKKIGLFGYGVVGKGYQQIVDENPLLLLDTKYIAVKHPLKHPQLNGLRLSSQDLLNQSDIDIWVEAINDAEVAFDIAKTLLGNGKVLVSASKKMIAEHLQDLLNLQLQNGGRLLYEASTAGSIPIINLLDKYYENEPILAVKGILNGTSNYILSVLEHGQHSFNEALKQAQELGFAETNPQSDIEALDARNKLTIINLHAFGLLSEPKDIFCFGIQNIHPIDIEFAIAKGFAIKQVAQSIKVNEGEISAWVAATFVKEDEPFYSISEENNAIQLDLVYAGRQLFTGKGAGALPTATAVLSDVLSISEKAYTYHKYQQSKDVKLNQQLIQNWYISFPADKVLPSQLKDSVYLMSNDERICISIWISLAQLIELKDVLIDLHASLILLPSEYISKR
jgi:homoserine dehydrogenase